VESVPGDTFLWTLICRTLHGKIPVYLAGLLLMCGAAGLLQRANALLLIIREKTLLPLLFFVLLNSLSPVFAPFHPASVAGFFLFFAILELLPSYQNPYEVRNMFNGTFYLGIGSLIWTNLLWAVLLFWIGMSIFRILNSRSFVASFLGIFTVYWAALAWCLWTDNFSIFSNILHNLKDVHFIFADKPFLIQGLGITGIAIVTGVMSARILYQKFDNSLRSRHFLSFLFTSGFYSFLLLLFYKQELTANLSIFYIPASALIAYFFSSLHNRRHIFLYYYLFLFSLLALFLIIHLE
jgi:hypothetical protein